MTTSPIAPGPQHVKGIVLDAESIRAELTECPQGHSLTPVTAQALIEMSDDELNAALQGAADDTFWEIYDDTRTRAIASLVAIQLDANIVVSDPAGA